MPTRRGGKTRRKSAKGRSRARPNPRPGARRPPILDLDAAPPDTDAPDRLGEERHPRLTGGDVDADWQRAETSGEEAVGGSVATPDQDVVDEIGRALGVEVPDETELRTSNDILRDRDRFRWHLERDAEDEAEGRPHHRRGTV